MSIIEGVAARTVRVPLTRPASFSGRSVQERWYTLVTVTDGDGASGIGFCYGGSDAGGLATAAVRNLFAPRLTGREANQTVGLWDELYQHALLQGRTGSVMRALSAVDTALWDLNARRAGLPLSQYLGAASLETVPAYASGGYYLDGKSIDDLAAEVEGYVADGFDAVKIKVGRVPIGEDAKRIAAARSVLGGDRLLMLDANNAWRDPASALRAMRAWEEFDPLWIEEPFSPDDIVNHARLAERTPVAVATGEIEAGRWRSLDLLRSGAVSILQSDAAVCGGITEFMRIAHLADAFGVPVAPHWFHHLHMHLVAAASNGIWVEYFPDADIFNFRTLVEPQPVVGGGRLTLPDAPGLGFDFAADAVSRHAVDDWD